MRASTNIVRHAGRAACALALVAMAAAPAVAKDKPWEKLDYPELGDVRIPDVEPRALSNGILVYMLEDHTWPLVDGQVLVNTGSAYEPAGKVGLASIMGDVLRTGGTTSMTGDELDEALESIGAFIESSVSTTQGEVDFSFLSKDAGRGLAMVADVLRNPAFDEEKIEVAVTGARAGIARRNDDLNGIVSREVQQAVWGEDHPYARNSEYATIDAITRDDLVGFYEYFYQPSNMRIALHGDFDSEKMFAQLEELFGDWEGENNPVPALPAPPTEGSRRVLVGDKDDVTQGRFALGHVGMKMDDPDYHAFSVMNRILGGGFGDRLFNQVRSNLGLAYNVGSSSGFGMARPGTFQAYCGTKSETMGEALAATLAEIDRIREEPVTAEELRVAKEAILNSHVFNFVDPTQTLYRKMYYDHYGYPDDFLESYPAKVRAVEEGQVLDVAKRRIDPSQFAIVAVGNVEDWDSDLSDFGPVEELDISIPEPAGPEFPEATVESIEKGRNLLAKALGAMGGKALETLQGSSTDMSVGMNMGGMEMAASMKMVMLYPDRLHNTIKLPFGEIVQAVSPEGGWVKSPQGMQTLPGDAADDMRDQVMQDPHYVLANFDQLEVQALDPEEVDGSSAQVVLVRTGDEGWVKLYFDGEGKLLQSTTKGKHPMTQAPGLMVARYADMKKVGGILVPHSIVVTHDGEQLFDMTVTKVELNPTVDSSIFAKPAS